MNTVSTVTLAFRLLSHRMDDENWLDAAVFLRRLLYMAIGYLDRQIERLKKRLAKVTV